MIQNKLSIGILALLGILFALTIIFVKFTVTGNYEGVFLLSGKDRYVFELKDDLYLNEGRRYLLGIDFEHGKESIYRFLRTGGMQTPYLYYEWNEKEGKGFVRNYLPNGQQVLTCFSRFLDDGGKEASGLFVGGGLPPNVIGYDMVKMNETGMAFHDGARWFHIWCNVNEAVFSTSEFAPISPSAWKFLGSKVLHHEDQGLILTSSHEVIVDRVPLRIDRYAHFRAGETYFILAVDFTNIGEKPATYSYLYADEPWLGEYGSSAGNVGWAADGLHQYVGMIDTRATSFVGMFDYGNEAAGERHTFTMYANFIAWFGEEKPLAYFSNGPYDIPQLSSKKQPLASNTRYIGVQWGPRTLQPKETVRYTMAIGMADRDPRTGFPKLPQIDLVNFP